MAQQPIELILLRQWASYLSVPIWLMDGEGNLLYYNEPAEPAIGRPFDLAGPINAQELDTMFETARADGSPLPNDELPILVALNTGRPCHGAVRFKGLDGDWRLIEIAAIPIERTGGSMLGVMAIFWEPAAQP